MTLEEIAVLIVRALVVAIVGGIALLFRRMREVEAKMAALTARLSAVERPDGGGDRLDAFARELTELRLHVAEGYISRDDWVPMTSRVIGMLEEHSRMLARLDERSQTTPTKDAER